MNIFSKLSPIAIPFKDVLIAAENDTYVIINWNSEKLGPEPSPQKLKEVYDEVQTYYLEYARLRRSEYPPIEDYIDGIVKGNQTQVQEYIDKCLAVKSKYPKP